MIFNPIRYIEPVFRPPAEARSAILQVTIGCSWNKCAFCEMYTSKKFKTRSFDDIKPEIELLGKLYSGKVKKVFLADGDAFVLKANKLLPILEEINKHFGRLQRVSCYAMPRDITSKTDKELVELREMGLKLLYIGIESGDDELLNLISKGETFSSTVEGIKKAQNAGIDTSIMIINGLGGRKYSMQHALKSAEIINMVSPKFLSTLTLSLPFGPKHFEKRIKGEYQQQTVVELHEELRLFIENLKVDNVIFRSNHVSNSLMLEGVLSKDNKKIIEQINHAISITPRNAMPISPSVL